MYSPKIDEELIPRLYRIAKARRTPMTVLVNKILKRSLVYLEKREAMKTQPALREEGEPKTCSEEVIDESGVL